MLALIIILVIAGVVVYIVRVVKPKRVRFRAGVAKFTVFDFEADGGTQSGEPDGQVGRAGDIKELPPTGTDGQ